MKYFANASERIDSGHENYIEFQLPGAEEEFWDKTSLYMEEAVMEESGFGAFWLACMYENIVFDMDTISGDELAKLEQAAKRQGGAVLEIVLELRNWSEGKLSNPKLCISVIREEDRAWECNRDNPE